MSTNNVKILIGFLFFILIVFSGKCFAQVDEISEIFIESTGNNKYEAKIKAHEHGMLRSVLLLANKMKLPTEGIGGYIPYQDLKDAFKPVMVFNEVSTNDKYSATVTYSYDKGHLFNLLLKYGGEKINDQFYEFIVIPVFKQRKNLSIWENDKRWNNYWNKYQSLLNKYKILYPKKSLYLEQKINDNNLFSLKYGDFTDIFNNVLFKNVMIVSAEFFTDRKTRESFVQIKKYILRPDALKTEISEEEYELTNLEDVSTTVGIVIDKIIDDYGLLRLEPDDVGAMDSIYEEQEEKAPIIMNFEVFAPEELEIVTNKLHQVKEIDHFVVQHDYNTRYKILIYTSSSEYDLAEGLYLNGLSYKIHGNLYNLIDVKKGI